MTSKEALNELNIILKTNYGTKRYSDIFEENLIKVIEKDLEIVNFIKKHYIMNGFNELIPVYLADVDEDKKFNELEEWLEKWFCK